MTGGIVAIAAVAASAYTGYEAARSAKKQQRFAQTEAGRAQAAEEERLATVRNSPGAKFAPFGFDALLNVFGSSMAGKGIDLTDARMAMGLTGVNGQKYGPAYGGFDAWSKYMQSDASNPANQYNPSANGGFNEAGFFATRNTAEEQQALEDQAVLDARRRRMRGDRIDANSGAGGSPVGSSGHMFSSIGT